MAPHVYSFTKFPNGVIRPLVNIRIINPSTNQYFLARCLLDTGADKCLFPADFALKTGHDLKNDGCENMVAKGLKGVEVTTWLHTFKLELFSEDFKTRIWRSGDFQIGCLEHNKTPPLLGCIGFLEFMNIRFNYTTKKIVIQV